MAHITKTDFSLRDLSSGSSGDKPISASSRPTLPSCPPTAVAQPVLNPEVSAFRTRSGAPNQLQFSSLTSAGRKNHSAPEVSCYALQEAPPDRLSGRTARTPHRNYTQLYVPEHMLQDTIAKYFPSREEANLYQCDIASCRGKFNTVLKVCAEGGVEMMKFFLP